MNRATEKHARRMQRIFGEEFKGHKYSVENAGNRFIIEELNRSLEKILCSFQYPIEGPVLEIGCGEGGHLPFLGAQGIKESHLVGIDLVFNMLQKAYKYHPRMSFIHADAAKLPFFDGSFNIILIFTLFSSVLDTTFQACIAREALRVLSSRGMLIVYDFRYNNPFNPDVRGVRKSDIRRLFSGCMIHFHSITLLPPLARRLGRYTGMLYPLLSKISFLRTHYLCSVQKI